jgi:aryl-alcohol dehydrogenase-like predicted oxidoreductase
MQYRILGKTGLRVSEIGLGTSKGLVEKISKADGERLVRRAVDLGVNFIDTARHYGRGEAEARVGEALRGVRNHAFICTKAGTLAGGGRSFRKKDLAQSLDQSLGQLKTDYVDVLMLHMASSAQLREDSEALEALLAFKEAGKARYIGASLDGNLIWEGLAVEAFDVLEISYNIADLYPEAGFFEKARARGTGLVVKEPLAVANFYRAAPDPPWTAHLFDRLQYYGFLKGETRVSAVEVALRFVLSCPYVHTAVPATSSLKHLEFNLSLSDGKPLLPEISDKVRQCYQKAVGALDGP